MGAGCWLGFAGATSFANVIFAQKPKELWLIDSGYNLVSFVVAGVILGACAKVPPHGHSCRSASIGSRRAARDAGTIVARNDTTSENAAMIARSRTRVTNGIDDTK